jgi:hypothetical protein
MRKPMKKFISLITITSLTATFVAMCAAVFSVTGIAKLFAGAAISVGIMASALELGKLVSISFLYQYWSQIPRMLKIYLTTASVILMLITSAGIYGYLSSAYAKVAATPLQLTADIQAASNKVESIEQDIQRKNDRLNQVISLRSQQETRLDQLISKSTTGSSTAVRSAQSTLSSSDKTVSQLQNEITVLSTTRDSLRAVNIGKQVEIETNGDIGTFVYIAKVFNLPLDTIVKWFTLIIVLVFDPLAVALVIAVNFLIKNKVSDDSAATNEVDIVTTEPYEIYVDPEPVMQEEVPPQQIEQSIPRDPQYFARSDFDWGNVDLWKNNPSAVRYHDTYVKNS